MLVQKTTNVCLSNLKRRFTLLYSTLQMSGEGDGGSETEEEDDD